MLPFWAWVHLGTMAIKWCSVFPKVLALIEPHHEIFSVICRTLVCGDLNPLQKYSRRILQPQSTGQEIKGYLIIELLSVILNCNYQRKKKKHLFAFHGFIFYSKYSITSCHKIISLLLLISRGGDHGIHCWWDLIRSKKLSGVSLCHAQVFAVFSSHSNSIFNVIPPLKKKKNVQLLFCSSYLSPRHSEISKHRRMTVNSSKTIYLILIYSGLTKTFQWLKCVYYIISKSYYVFFKRAAVFFFFSF